MKVLIVGNHSVVRQGVSFILREAFPYMEVLHADTFEKALEVLKIKAVSLLLFDVNQPEGNSVPMVSAIYASYPDIKILMFSAYDEGHHAMPYIDMGVNGYLSQLSSDEEIVEAVKIILGGGKYITPWIRERILNNVVSIAPDNGLHTLSSRELEIAKMLVKGQGNLEIANKLGIRMSTVSTYKSRIIEKLGVSNVVSLAEKFRVYSINTRHNG